MGLSRWGRKDLLTKEFEQKIKAFIDERCWDEARIITNSTLIINKGLAAPILKEGKKINEEQLLSDTIEIYKPGN